MPSFAGLQTSFLSWLMLAGVTACWMLSVKLVREWERDGWRAILRSLYGFVWLGFGVDILLRFVMLSYNAVEWGNDTPRLIAESADTVNLTLAYCGVFWVLVAVAYRFTSRRRTAGPLTLVRMLNVDLVYAIAVPSALFCSVLFYLTDGSNHVPVALLTPLSALGYMYVVPATIVWWDHFRRPEPAWRIGTFPLIVLLPALVHAWRSPYRENVAPLLLIPLIAAIFAGRKPTLRKLIPAALICFLAASSFITAYRRVKWENVPAQEVVSEMRGAGVVEWLTGSWGDQMKRFHSFDSMLLTVHLVPRAKPYSGRNVLVSPFIRGFVPRIIYGDKGVSDAGERFGVEIWAYDNPMARDHGDAAIAPSMPGDLYTAGGVLYITLGAVIWGGLLGLLDGWKAHLPRFSAAAITVLVATSCAMSVERDFDHSVAGLLQILILLVVVCAVIGLARRRDATFAMNFNPTLERS
jgi:hypothetical protein